MFKEKKQQKFHADCKIRIAEFAKGKKAKRCFALSLVDQEQREMLRFYRYSGMVSSLENISSALLLALEQSLRLHKEKVKIQMPSVGLESLVEKKSSIKSETLQKNLRDIRLLMPEFRLFEFESYASEELKELVAFAETNFAKKRGKGI